MQTLMMSSQYESALKKANLKATADNWSPEKLRRVKMKVRAPSRNYAVTAKSLSVMVSSVYLQCRAEA